VNRNNVGKGETLEKGGGKKKGGAGRSVGGCKLPKKVIIRNRS